MLHVVSDNKVHEMMPDVINQMPDFMKKVGTVRAERVVRAILLNHEEPGYLAESMHDWQLTEQEIEKVFEIAKSCGCDFESRKWE